MASGHPINVITWLKTLEDYYSSSSQSKSSKMSPSREEPTNSSSARRSFLVGRPVPRWRLMKPLMRDAVDLRITNDVKNGTGRLINAVSDTPGYPTFDTGTAITDTDKDGMPDEWEVEQMRAIGVTDNSISDFKPSAYNLTAKYTNLDVYLNELVCGTFPAGAKATETR